MEKLDLEKFNPKKAEVISLANKYKGLTIKNIEDLEGYKKVDDARKDLKRMRVEISKTAKEARSDALSYQKAVIELEKDLINEIEPVEKDLIAKQEKINSEKEIKKRKEYLPVRTEKLKEIDIEITEDKLLLMNSQEFNEFFNLNKEEWLNKKEIIASEKKEKEEAEIKAKQDKLDKEKRELEEDKRIQKAKEMATEDAKRQAIENAEIEKERVKKDAEEALRKAEQDKKDAIELEKKKAELEKQRLIDEQKRKEKERLNAIEKEKQIKAEGEAKLKEEDEKKRKNQAYQDFLNKNGYSQKTMDSFHIERNGDKFVLYKKVDEIIIK